MADNNRQIALDVLAAVGGAENVITVEHCMTRLRFSLKDQTVVDDDQVKAIKGVMGVQKSGVQYQVIIGQNVPKVYEILCQESGLQAKAAIDENLDAPAEKLTLKGAGMAILDYLSKSMVALIPAMLSAAMFRTIAVVFGDMLGLWATDSAIYNLFYNWLYNAFFYFLPLILGWSAAKQLGCSQVLGMMLGGVLIAPEFLELVEAASETGATTTAVYGLFPAMLNDYSTSVLPIILSMPVLWQVEKFFKKVIPDILSTVFVPFCTMFVVVPISLCVLAPIGSWCGNAIGTVMFTLGGMGGIVTVLSTAVIAAVWEFLIITGMHQVLLTLAIVQMLQTGYDACVVVAAGISVWSAWGMALGAFLLIKGKEEKSAHLGYFLSGFVGGVTEPALYGCAFKYHMRPFVGPVVGGFVGGMIAALAGVKVYVLGASNVLSVLGFVGGGTVNLAWGVFASVVALAVGAAMTYFFGFSKEDLQVANAE